MSVKSDISNQHMQLLMEAHGNKRSLTGNALNVFFTGDLQRNSIGEVIREELFLTLNAKVKSFKGDIRDENDIGDCELFKTNTLIMCHGVSHLDWFEDCPASKMQEIMDVNITGTMRMAQHFVQQTINAPYRKTIIMIGSMAHKAVLNGSAAYCASKAAVAHLARCMAWELAPKGYDVFCIHPSNTLGTPMSEQTIQGLERYRMLTRDAAQAYWNDSQIRSASLTTTEIAQLVMHLLSGNAGYLAGTQLELAGGQR